MRRISLPLFAAVLGWYDGLHAQLSGNYTIPTDFPTIQAAFTALQTNGASGAVTITLPQGTTWDPATEPAVITLNGYTCNNCQVTIVLDTTVALIKSPGTSAGQRFVFRFTGTIQNFTLDGRGKFTVQSTATGASTTAVVGFVSTTATPLNLSNVVIRGLRLIGNGRNNTFAGVYVGGDASLPSTISTTSSINGFEVVGCVIRGVRHGINIRGSRPITQNVRINRDSIGLPMITLADTNRSFGSYGNTNEGAGIYLTGITNPSVTQNVVMNAWSVSAYYTSGIRLDSCENFSIERNYVAGIRYLGTGGWVTWGLSVSLPASFIGTPTNTVANNMIADIVADGYATTTGTFFPSGIFLRAPATVVDARTQILHNSIHLFGNSLPGSTLNNGGASSGITIFFSIQGGVRIQGNLIQNNFRPSLNPDTRAYGIAIMTSTISPVGFVINYNGYRVASGYRDTLARLGSINYLDLAAWQSAPTSPDPNSYQATSNMPFIGSHDLHLDPTAPFFAINAANTGMATDYDGQSRPLPNPGPGPNGDPGTLSDIGADEVDGTPPPCLPVLPVAPNIIVITSPNAGSSYLWGTQVIIDTTGTNSPTASGSLRVIYSYDGGSTWVNGPAISAFPATINLPPLVAPLYTANAQLAIRAFQPASHPACPDLSDTSDVYYQISLTDRPGNRLATAIPLTLTYNASTQRWEASVQDSTIGPYLSNAYGAGSSSSNPRGTGANDLFFKIILPACMDSLIVSTCPSFTNFDTYVSVINLIDADTIAGDDGCAVQTLIRVIGRAGSTARINTFTGYATNVVDTMRLAAGDEIIIVVEGWNTPVQGRFQLDITGFESPSPLLRPDLGADLELCITAGTTTLTATTPGASTYEWVLNGNVISGANTDSYTLPLVVGTHEVIARAIFFSLNGPACHDTTSDTVLVIVSPEPQASIQVGSTVFNSGDTYNLSASGSSVSETFTASSSVSGNTYGWELYNPGSNTPDATGTGSSFTHTFSGNGLYTLILISTNGGCDERDTLYVNVDLTSALSRGSHSFSAFPNPNRGAFLLIAPAPGSYTLYITDMAGKVVYTGRMEEMRKELHLDLPAGSYQLFISGEGKSDLIRLLITE
ncbi:MAG: T9SS type A sorting domain-containing protein [Bacteroidia bacterium]|nr:T9SS type A sorting domain-containing protein [Bacteroidia bacterium]